MNKTVCLKNESQACGIYHKNSRKIDHQKNLNNNLTYYQTEGEKS